MTSLIVSCGGCVAFGGDYAYVVVSTPFKADGLAGDAMRFPIGDGEECARNGISPTAAACTTDEIRCSVVCAHVVK